MTSDEKEQTLIKALGMLMETLPDKAFYGKLDGPSIIMTDNCDELRNSLKFRFPNSLLLLCVFHMLQQVWRWLFDRTHSIRPDERVEIMKQFRKILYCENKDEFDKLKQKYMDSGAFLENW